MRFAAIVVTVMARLTVLLAALACSVLMLAAGTVSAKTITGTPRNDTLRGTSSADKLYGRGGNDKLYGRAGDDLMVGGAGDDLLVGGQGVDRLLCGPGRDTAIADAQDRVGNDCEIVKGLPQPPPPAPTPAPPPLPDRAFGDGVRGGLSGVVGELTFVFNAEAGTPSATGHFQSRTPSSHFEVDVKCLTVSGKMAAIGGVVTVTENSAGILPGDLVVFWIQDNSPAAADQMSSVLYFSPDELPAPAGIELPAGFPASCPGATVPSGWAFLPLVSGDLTVVDQP